MLGPTRRRAIIRSEDDAAHGTAGAGAGAGGAGDAVVGGEGPEALAEMRRRWRHCEENGYGRRGEDQPNMGRLDTVHPASSGEDSQTSYFAKAPLTLHVTTRLPLVCMMRVLPPARPGQGPPLLQTDSGGSCPQARSWRSSLSTLKAKPGDLPAHFDVHENDPESEYLIADSTKELALMEYGGLKARVCCWRSGAYDVVSRRGPSSAIPPEPISPV